MKNKTIFVIIFTCLILLAMAIGSFFLATAETGKWIVNSEEEVIELKRDNLQKDQLITALLEKIEKLKQPAEE